MEPCHFSPSKKKLFIIDILNWKIHGQSVGWWCGRWPLVSAERQCSEPQSLAALRHSYCIQTLSGNCTVGLKRWPVVTTKGRREAGWVSGERTSSFILLFYLFVYSFLCVKSRLFLLLIHPSFPCPTSCDVWSVQTADQRVALCAGQLEWGSAREHRARPQRVKETVQTDKVKTFLLILTPGLMASVGIPRSLCQNCIAVCAGVFVFWASGGSLYFFWECICIVGFFF